MLNKFLDSKIFSFSGRVKMIAIALAFYSIYIYFFTNYLYVYFLQGQFGGPIISPLMTPEQKLIRICFVAPIWEEIAFRYAPIQIAVGFSKSKFLIPMIALSSCVFGVIHGGPANIFIQGVLGFAASIVYVKSNYKLWVSIAFHASWNLLITLVQ